jgi:hypothetical protein
MPKMLPNSKVISIRFEGMYAGKVNSKPPKRYQAITKNANTIPRNIFVFLNRSLFIILKINMIPVISKAEGERKADITRRSAPANFPKSGVVKKNKTPMSIIEIRIAKGFIVDKKYRCGGDKRYNKPARTPAFFPTRN